MAAKSQKAQNRELIQDLLSKTMAQEIPELPEGEYERIFGDDSPSPGNGLTYAKLLVHKLVTRACAGNDKSIQEVLDRMLGKPVQATENTNINHNMTYLTFLEECVERDKILDAETVPSLPPDPDQTLRDAGLL